MATATVSKVERFFEAYKAHKYIVAAGKDGKMQILDGDITPELAVKNMHEQIGQSPLVTESVKGRVAMDAEHEKRHAALFPNTLFPETTSKLVGRKEPLERGA